MPSLFLILMSERCGKPNDVSVDVVLIIVPAVEEDVDEAETKVGGVENAGVVVDCGACVVVDCGDVAFVGSGVVGTLSSTV